MNAIQKVTNTLGLDGLFSTGISNQNPAPTKNIGAPGFAVYGGYVVEGEENVRLTGREKYRTFSNVLVNTAIIAAGTRYFLDLIAKAEWKFEPARIGDAEATEEAKRLARLVKEITNDMQTPWPRVVRRAAMYRFYGFSIQVWTAKRREDGVLGFMDVAPRPQFTIERWDTDEFGDVLAVVQRSQQNFDEILLPRDRLVYAVDDSLDDNPAGLGLFRHVVEPVTRLKRFEQLEGYSFEADLRGVPVARAPLAELDEMVRQGTITSVEKEGILTPIRNFLKNHIKNPGLGMMLDSITYQTTDERGVPSQVRQFDLDLLQSNSTTQQEVALTIERLNREIARVLGVEMMLLGSNSVGSQALSRDKSQSFDLKVESTLTELQAVFKKDYLETLWSLNGWDPALMPTIKVEAVQYRNVQEITGAIRDLSDAGAILAQDDPAINEIREMMGISRATAVDLTNIDDSAINARPNGRNVAPDAPVRGQTDGA